MPAIDPQVEAERLRHVRARIEEVLCDADVCAQVILAGRAGRFEDFTHLGASWCKARIERHEGREFIGVRSKAVEYGGDIRRQGEELAWSVGVVAGFGDIGWRVALMWIQAAKYIDEATHAEHTPLRRDDPRDAP